MSEIKDKDKQFDMEAFERRVVEVGLTITDKGIAALPAATSPEDEHDLLCAISVAAMRIAVSASMRSGCDPFRFIGIVTDEVREQHNAAIKEGVANVMNDVITRFMLATTPPERMGQA